MIGAIVAGITGAGGAVLSSYDSIATASGTGSSATITFNLSGVTGYKHLQIRGVAEVDTYASTINVVRVRFNSDAGNNYSEHVLYGYAGSVTATGTASVSGVPLYTSLRTDSYYMRSAHIIDILDYTSTSKNKTVRALYGSDFNSLYQGNVGMSSGVWLNTNAITSISLVAPFNFLTTTKYALYGIKEA
jgi:hypothetical protein